MKLRDLMNPNIVVFDESVSLEHVLEKIRYSGISYVISTRDQVIQNLFHSKYLLEAYMYDSGAQRLQDLHPVSRHICIQPDVALDLLYDTPAGTYMIIEEGGHPLGVFYLTNTVKQLYFFFTNQQFSMPFQDFLQVFENLEEEIIIARSDGTICYVNPKAEEIMNLPIQEIMKKTLYDMENERIFYPSAALQVLKTGKKVHIQTKLKNGEERISTAIPIFNEKQELEYTVCTSKNIQEILDLNQQLNSKKQKLEQMDQEILRMHKQDFEEMGFYFNSPAMYRIMKAIKRIAPLDITVLIQGETGVGKDLVAKSIHYLSSRNSQPFVKINCGLIPENLIEAELFGYEEGAFTGASKNGKKGKIEAADGGTLFLDEIGDMPLPLQIKLLDFIQDSTYVKVGGTKRHKANIRIISATNRNLKEMVDEGTFRMDLFYRLNVFDLQIPPLRERLEDIPELTEYFLKKFNTRYKLNRYLSPDSIYEMYQYSWPGNIRELEHTLERLIVMSETSEITADTFREVLTQPKSSSIQIICNGIPSYKQAKNDLERLLIEKAYTLYGSSYRAADALGIDQSTAARLIKKYNIKKST